MKSNTSIVLFVLLPILFLATAFSAVAQKWEASTSWTGMTYKDETTQITIHVDKVQQSWKASLTLNNIAVSGWALTKLSLQRFVTSPPPLQG
jgi:hypothetical protein